MNDNKIVVEEEKVEDRKDGEHIVVKASTEDKKLKKIIVIIVIVFFLIAIGITVFVINSRINKARPDKIINDSIVYKSAYRIGSNKLSDFDLFFIQAEDNKSNLIYSPLSIKYALALLEKATEGSSNGQISALIGSYYFKKYIKSNHLSLVNGVFVKDSLSNNVKNEYSLTVKDKYDADVKFDSFKSADNINNWVKDNTFNLIENIVDDDTISKRSFELINALAIDMEWEKKIQADSYKDAYSVSYEHENYSQYVLSLDSAPIKTIKFDNDSRDAKALEIGASANRYDIVKKYGSNNIKSKVKEALEEYKAQNGNECLTDEQINNVDSYLDNYINELDSNNNRVNYSTDFMFNDTENEKVFVKDLKKYNGVTLQYVAIMPKKISLSDYVEKNNARRINTTIKNAKDLSIDSFKKGVVTEITGFIPIFNYDYKLNLKKDLNSVGIVDVFDSKKANLSGMLKNSKGYYIDDASHKANIDFSNEGIKAAAVTEIGGAGATGCGFDYKFDVPVEKIDITFDNPYLYLIRDKDTGEIWFMGTVYEPTI